MRPLRREPQMHLSAAGAWRLRAASRVVFAAYVLHGREVVITKRTEAGEDTGEPTLLGAVVLDLGDAVLDHGDLNAARVIFGRVRQCSDDDLTALAEEADRELTARGAVTLGSWIAAIGGGR